MTHSDYCYFVAVVLAVVAVLWALSDKAFYGALVAAAVGAIALGLLLA